ncbi:type II secretion system protein GspL [Pseudomonas saliphila]|uniref:type II secretion system protein GspL n=1 Tax=Pseudomonas saliphila TaxID=2586906 RepID=UPI001238CB34|nr:type II secretion system protein GspL [Pseudomonas saliphila]
MLIVLLPEHLQPDSPGPVRMHWWHTDRDGSLVDAGLNTLDELHAKYPAERMRALVPPSAVTLYRVRLPVRKASAVRAALPYALEDFLSQELEELHFAAGPRRPDDRVAAAVVEQSNMAFWQDLFEQARWRLEALMPLSELHAELPPAGVLRVQRSPWPTDMPLVMVTAADQEPVMMEEGLLAFWLQRRLADRDPEDRIVELYGVDAATLDLDIETQIISGPDLTPELLAPALRRATDTRPVFNLLTGPYASSMAAPPWRKMRTTMIAAGVLLAVLATQFGLESWTLARERDRLQAEINSLFDIALPSSRRIDPVTQFREALEGGTSNANGGMGGLLYEVLAAASSKDSKAEIREFRATPLDMEIELHVASFAELETIRANLAAKPQLRETLQGADSGADGVTARLKVARSDS